MSRLIDADEMIKNLAAMRDTLGYDAISIDGMIKGLLDSPKIDAEIVVHGHCVINWLGDCHCSNCNGYIDYTSKYCNWCGAKLDESEERE